MLKNYLSTIETIIDERHYLKFNSALLAQYQQSYAENVRFLLDKLSQTQQGDLLNNKLMFERVFDANQEKQYIQAACETTVTSCFAQRFPKSFKYEPRLSSMNRKNVECQFKAFNYTYNIEVKCPTFDQLEAQDLGNHFLFNLPVRTDRDIMNELMEALNATTKQGGLLSYVTPHRMDNNLKDYLIGASDKFAGADTSTDINILVVCCDNNKNMQEFMNYLFQYGGFFHEKPTLSIAEPVAYKHVDVLILCNLYYRHAYYYNKSTVKEHWDFAKSFNLVFDNHHREILEPKVDGIDYFREHFLPNHTHELIHFIYHSEQAKECKQQGLPKEVMEILGLEIYISEEAKKGNFYF